MKQLIYRVALLGLTCSMIPPLADAQAYEPFLGEIQMFAFNFCPVGWLPLNGQLLSISQNTALFSLLGTTYGGDGVTTFALPKWGSNFTANGGAFVPCIATQGVFPSRS
jgi:microcystin-dependent protein